MGKRTREKGHNVTLHFDDAAQAPGRASRVIRMGFATFDQVTRENVRTRVPRTPLKNRSSQVRTDLICEVQIHFGGAFPPSPASPKLLKKGSPDRNHASHKIGSARQTLQIFLADDIALDGTVDLRMELTQDFWLDADFQFRVGRSKCKSDPLHCWTFLSLLELQRKTKGAPKQEDNGNVFVPLRDRASDG